MPKSRYLRWSFRLVIYIAIIAIAQFYLTVSHTSGFGGSASLVRNLFILSILHTSFTLLGTLLLILSFVHREPTTWKTYISILAYTLFLIMMTF